MFPLWPMLDSQARLTSLWFPCIEAQPLSSPVLGVCLSAVLGSRDLCWRFPTALIAYCGTWAVVGWCVVFAPPGHCVGCTCGASWWSLLPEATNTLITACGGLAPHAKSYQRRPSLRYFPGRFRNPCVCAFECAAIVLVGLRSTPPALHTNRADRRFVLPVRCANTLSRSLRR